MKKIIYMLLLVIIMAGCGKLDKIEQELQHDLDIARLGDIKAIGALLNEYHQKTGRYPFTGLSDLPTYTYIATKEQLRGIKNKPPYDHEVRGVKDLIAELEKTLGTQVVMPFDPQRVPVKKPNFYIYLVNGDDYYLTVHLYSSYAFAENISENYNRLEITNTKKLQQGSWPYEDLVKREDFIKALGEKPHKPGYVKAMRKEMREKGLVY